MVEWDKDYHERTGKWRPLVEWKNKEGKISGISLIPPKEQKQYRVSPVSPVTLYRIGPYRVPIYQEQYKFGLMYRNDDNLKKYNKINYLQTFVYFQNTSNRFFPPQVSWRYWILS